jgi:hypothetical protein
VAAAESEHARRDGLPVRDRPIDGRRTRPGEDVTGRERRQPGGRDDRGMTARAAHERDRFRPRERGLAAGLAQEGG